MTTSTMNAMSTPEPLLDLERLVAGIRWRRRTWLSSALVGLLAGVLLAVLLPAGSTAVARVYVVHENEQAGTGTALMETDVAVFETSRIADAALKKLSSAERPEVFLGSYSGTAVADNVLELTVRGASDSDAVARAQALAEAFIADHVQRGADLARAQAQALIDRRTQAESDLAGLNKSLAPTANGAPGASPQDVSAQLDARRAALRAQIQDLAQRAEVARIGAPQVAAGTQILDAPHVTTRPLPVAAALDGAVGFGLGLGLGLALAAVASIVQDRPVLRRNIAAHLGASVIVQLPAPRRGPTRPWRRSGGVVERERVAAALVRKVRDAPEGVSLLELGCPETAAALAFDIAEELALERTVVVVDDLPGTHLRERVRESESSIQLVDGAEYPAGRPSPGAEREHRIGVGTVGPGTAWMDLGRLGSETLLVVRAGYASTLWLHTVARQLADAEILVIGVVLVHPDPRDRSDGTLWDGLHTALRGRVAARPRSTTKAAGPGSEDGPVVNPAPPSNGAATAGVPSGVGRRPTPRPRPVAAGGRPTPRPRPVAAGGRPTDKLPPVVASTPVDHMEVS